MNKEYNYLNIIWTDEIEDWDTNVISKVSIKSRFPLHRLEDYVISQNTKYDISNPENEYKILGINSIDGIFDAYTEKGYKINQKYKKMQNGWVAYNPYRINIGAIGVKKDIHKNEYISPAYVVFSCNDNLYPEYLCILMRTPMINKVIRQNTTGVVRQNLTFNNLKKLEIPIPDNVSTQLQLVGRYNSYLQEATQKEFEAQQKEQEIRNYIIESLGINAENANNPNNNSFKEIMFDALTVWSVDENTKNEQYFSTKYPLYELSSKIKIRKGFSLPKNKLKGDTYPVYGGNGIIGYHSEYLFSGEGIVIGRVGEYCGNVHLVSGDYWVTDNAFIVYSKDDSVSLEYLYIALKALNLNRYKKIAGQPSISQNNILSLSVPIPEEKKVQDEIAGHISVLEEKYEMLKQTANNLRESAMVEFENEIFE
ncbi:MAG: restriction endonuclease subunit S [Bacteroidales bacterium]|nr:restriction endonuclease subunit S [Bacteroidales bacterium]